MKETTYTGSDEFESKATLAVAELKAILDSSNDHSLVVQKAVERFAALGNGGSAPSLDAYARWLVPLGESLTSSICRQLEVEGYFNRQTWFQSISKVTEWPKVGEQVDSFRLLEQVGRGGHSRVFLCRQVGVGDRQVIVKFTRNNFLEADVLGRLRHPNIVPIFSAVSNAAPRLSHLCMPFLGRSTLCDYIETYNGPVASPVEALQRASNLHRLPSDAASLPIGFAPRTRFRTRSDCVVWIGLQLANALAHAHEQGIVHGDVKPSNVLLAWDGTPLLMDFNLSGSLAHAVEPKGGTLPYMPPEQLQAVGLDHHDTVYDRRSDIFSLGVLLYELLSGRLPFTISSSAQDRRTIATDLLQQQRTGVQSLYFIDKTISRSLSTTVERCIAFDPEARLSSSAALADLLKEESLIGRRLTQAIRRNRFRVVVLAAAITAVSAGAAVMAVNRPPESVRLFKQGIAFLGDGSASEAQLLLDRSVTLQPNDVRARFALAYSMLKLGEFARAQHCFFEVYKRDNSARAAAYMAYCISLQGSMTNAIPWYIIAIERGGDCAEVQNNLAVAYELGSSQLSPEEQLAEAKALLRRALQSLPLSHIVQYNWLRIQLALANSKGLGITHDDAEMAIRLSQELPNDWSVQLHAARILALRTVHDPSRQESALDCLRRAVLLGRKVQEDSLIWHSLRSSPRFLAVMRSRPAKPATEFRSPLSRQLEPVSLAPLIADY